MADLRRHNDTLAQHAESLSQRLLAAEQAGAESDIKLQHTLQNQVSSQVACTTQTFARLLCELTETPRLSRLADLALACQLHDSVHAAVLLVVRQAASQTFDVYLSL